MLKHKTTWTGIGSCIAAGIGYATGGMTFGEAANMFVLGLAAIFLRAGIAKSGPHDLSGSW